MIEDLSLFMGIGASGFAEAVTVHGTATQAVFDTAAELVFGDVIGASPTLLLPATAVPAVADGSACTVRGGTYRVRQVLAEPPDGAFVRLVLVRA